MSSNLPISAQVVGDRATRTTHPQVLNGFTKLFSAIFETPFVVDNPFSWMTKAQIVQAIHDADCGDLIKHTVSCTRAREMTRLRTHCGVCSQCIDRRFATLSAGCPDAQDPEEMYGVALLLGERARGESRTLLESYAATARRAKDMSATTFFTEFDEVHRATRHIQGMTVDDAANRIFGLYKRHAADVCDVIARGIRDHAQDISYGRVPSTCLLILALPDEYKQPAIDAASTCAPVLVLDDIRDGETNRGLLARVVGSGRFEGVNKKLGARGLFFVQLLFKSRRVHEVVGERLTVVTEGEASEELLKWRDMGYLKFTGKDQNQPGHRVQKMWREFVRQMEKEKNLLNLFANTYKDETGQRLYAQRLRPEETQIIVASIPALSQKPSP